MSQKMSSGMIPDTTVGMAGETLTPGRRLLRSVLNWAQRHRLLRQLEIALAIAALVAGTLTYLHDDPGRQP